MEVHVHKSNTSNTRTTIEIGQSILNESTQKLEFKKRGIKFADFQVLRETTTYCSSILIEMGFITNTDEANYFLD